MNMNTFFQACVYLCFILIFFNLAIAFVNGMEIFEPVGEGSVLSGNNESGIFNATTDLSHTSDGSTIFGIDAMWAVVLTAGGLVTIAVAILIHSTVPIGLFLFSAVFWTSYMQTIGVVNSMSWIPGDFLIIGTVGVFFLFAAAVIGMLTGSG